MRLFDQYKNLRRENYVLFFGRVVTNLGAMVWPMLTLIMNQKMGMSASTVAVVMVVAGIVLRSAVFLIVRGWTALFFPGRFIRGCRFLGQGRCGGGAFLGKLDPKRTGHKQAESHQEYAKSDFQKLRYFPQVGGSRTGGVPRFDFSRCLLNGGKGIWVGIALMTFDTMRHMAMPGDTHRRPSNRTTR